MLNFCLANGGKYIIDASIYKFAMQDRDSVERQEIPIPRNTYLHTYINSVNNPPNIYVGSHLTDAF